MWDARSNKAVTVVNTKGENINITWSPDGQTIAVGNKEDLVTLIDSRTYKVKAERQFKFEVNEISWNMTRTSMIEREMLAASRSGVSLLNKGFGGSS